MKLPLSLLLGLNLILLACSCERKPVTTVPEPAETSADKPAPAETPSAEPFPVVWTLSEGVVAPESTYLDQESGFLFVSQIGEGGGMGKDGDGWISKLTPEGKVIQAKWATGLNAPKGLRSTGQTLWVADIDRILAFSIESGKQVTAVKVPGAKFLNDLACAADGTVYVSDMIAGKIYQYKDDKLSVLIEGDQVGHPNGLLIQKGKLIIAGWGQDIQDDFSTKKLGRLLSLDLKSGKITPITPQPTGNLDGVESDGAGGFVVTDWIAGRVMHITAAGKSRVLATFPKGAADHAYLPDKKWLILPEMLENRISAFDLSKALKP
jgi:sugar lactone lactonase YvrE